jgi:hypothetical protein
LWESVGTIKNSLCSEEKISLELYSQTNLLSFFVVRNIAEQLVKWAVEHLFYTSLVGISSCFFSPQVSTCPQATHPLPTDRYHQHPLPPTDRDEQLRVSSPRPHHPTQQTGSSSVGSSPPPFTFMCRLGYSAPLVIYIYIYTYVYIYVCVGG